MTNNQTTNTITIHIDGSCQTQTGEGGWAAILQCGKHERVLQGHAEDTTSNAMELTALYEGLSALNQNSLTVQIFTDSQYVAKGVNEWLSNWKANNWTNSKKKPIANAELWKTINVLLNLNTVTVTWVPREQNARADELAQQARTNPETLTNIASSTTKEIRVFFSGSREATPAMLEAAKAKVREAHKRGYTILVGDNPRGVDRAVVQECNRLKAKVIVAGVGNYPRNGGCKHGSYQKVDRSLYQANGGGRLNGFTVRDRYLADNAQYGIFYWNGRSSGTKAAYDYMATHHPERAFLVPLKPNYTRA